MPPFMGILDWNFRDMGQIPDENQLSQPGLWVEAQTSVGLSGACQGFPLCQNFLMNRILGILLKIMNPCVRDSWMRHIPDVYCAVFLVCRCEF